MKTIIEEITPERTLSFPKLMICRGDDTVVYFTKPCVGLSLTIPDVGVYENCYDMDLFEDFKGRITLEQ